ncbi:MAG: TatD family hydrolase [Bacteroidales bacterium]|nr:TatD family hydrolase [Bacteroidales bacterium]
MYTDSHTHLYLDAFEADREQMIQRALDAGVTRMLLPNIDSTSMEPMFSLAERFPDHCFPMMGLHPTSVKEDYIEELGCVEAALKRKDIIAIGETGIDLYWDKTFLKEQEEVFATQIRWAMELDLPLVIHARDSFQEIFSILDKDGGPKLRGVFHSFTGGPDELERALSYNFMIGINGIVTFKNSNLSEVVRAIPTNRLLLETDSPFLAPVPYRGKRNESSYLVETAEKAAEIYNLTKEEVAMITSSNAEQLFRLKPQNES